MALKGRYVYEWPRPMVTVDAVVFLVAGERARVLLIKRGREPFRGMWALPGGFVEMDEELHDAAGRELKEETGLTGVELTQMHTFGKPGRDPRGRQVSIAYTGMIDTEPQGLRAGDDAADFGWFEIDDLPDVGFDHSQIIKMAIERVLKTED